MGGVRLDLEMWFLCGRGGWERFSEKEKRKISIPTARRPYA
jgi:hypothetical protein